MNVFSIVWKNFKQWLSVDKPPQSNAAPPRSLYLRHLDCGSCNGCELELNALSNPLYDSVQYGIQFESSPRHADALVMTGPYTRNLDEAARLTLAAMPAPIIITIGDCARDGHIFQDTYAIMERPSEIQSAIQQHIPGCPPTPGQILAALQKFKTE